MQLVAYLKGERVDATQMAHEPWRALVNHPDYPSLTLIECGLRASRVTRRGRQFFKHYPDIECPIQHKSESAQHLAMKQALKNRINAMPEWRAEVEHAHPGRVWIADVMATHASGKRLAFEVQLSPQSEDEYIRRSQRYADDRIRAVWVVPDNLDWFRVQMPMIVTGFGKTSDLPGTPGSLMDLAHHQPLVGKRASVGAAVDAVLDLAFQWPHGTPKHQLDEIARLEQMKAEAAADKQARAGEAAELRRLAEAETAARFIAAAAAPGASAARPVLAAKRTWASEVHCLTGGHPMLIWRLTKPAPERASSDPMWRPTMENFDNVRAHVDAWLAAAGSSLAKAMVYKVKGWPVRRTFVCPECKQIIQGRWVSALPPEKWTLIAEASAASAEARDMLHRKPPTQPSHFSEEPRPARLPVQVEESDWRFIGPRRKPYWMTESGSEELPYRLAAKKAHAERMEQLRANPRYRVSPNGFRFECTDCGGEFEDDKEGIHADRGCVTPGTRSFGWR
ncbi:hypothetical protein GU243_00500 [Pseudarthrobacter psychrotolerans]|uniref:Competence protein CoiA nuclease-like domain-containing protein n=1 Tax=Pseudarthrobacter psychrotolerans TaxID=2697569 RepID=A0A6P1ND60_9MICC|nr:hypothetical protein [Pseudarthrobacter psychrotolerans]QHK18515.1 hypothetical protein GU243_00500 [Pseudarthrobacter psychrotolerans]